MTHEIDSLDFLFISQESDAGLYFLMCAREVRSICIPILLFGRHLQRQRMIPKLFVNTFPQRIHDFPSGVLTTAVTQDDADLAGAAVEVYRACRWTRKNEGTGATGDCQYDVSYHLAHF